MVVGLKLQEPLKTFISFLLHPAEETAAGTIPWSTLQLTQVGGGVHTVLELKSIQKNTVFLVLSGVVTLLMRLAGLPMTG